ncbi:hypothetical protein [uncultured Sphingomonas sp.]|uniref:hypothetical protein n=1 Tax=uncultured Sphingomonas sp. TaxID=158754 RepID=UPI0035CA0CED
MATDPIRSEPPFDIREQLARIDKLMAETGKIRQETRLAPWTIVVTALGAGAALFAAGAAFTKLVLG